MKRLLWIVAVVLVSNALALVAVARNGPGQADTTVTLTERELRLAGTATDNTGMTLLLQWDRDQGAEWFDRAKLAAIGFDCSVDPTAANAWMHYVIGSLARETYVVLEYDPSRLPAEDANQVAQAERLRPREFQPRLRPIDAGNDEAALRARYSDRHRYMVTAGVVGTWLHRPTPQDHYRLNGRVMRLLPDQMYVPREWQATIRAAVGKTDDRDAALTRSPRYEVTLRYGRSLLPKIVSVRKLAGNAREGDPPGRPDNPS